MLYQMLVQLVLVFFATNGDHLISEEYFISAEQKNPDESKRFGGKKEAMARGEERRVRRNENC